MLKIEKHVKEYCFFLQQTLANKIVMKENMFK